MSGKFFSKDNFISSGHKADRTGIDADKSASSDAAPDTLAPNAAASDASLSDAAPDTLAPYAAPSAEAGLKSTADAEKSAAERFFRQIRRSSGNRQRRYFA